MQELPPAALSERLRDEDNEPLVLYIRHEADFEEWHIPGSINVDVYDELTEDSEQAEEASRISHASSGSSSSVPLASSHRPRRTYSVNSAMMR